MKTRGPSWFLAAAVSASASALDATAIAYRAGHPSGNRTGLRPTSFEYNDATVILSGMPSGSGD
jgi:hypothetical protein